MANFKDTVKQTWNKVDSWLEKTFKLNENKTNVKTEVIAGLTTFMAMVYILMVNAGMFSDLGAFGNAGVTSGQLYNGVYIATAISAVIGTVLIGLLAKLPLAQASGMGLNAFFVYTVCGFGMANGMTYANALIFILLDGIIFLLLTVTGLRKTIFNAIPDSVKVAIPAGIGLFIAFIGLQNAGVVVLNDSTKVALVSMNLLNGGLSTLVTAFNVFATFAGVIAIAVLSKKGVKGAVLWGILGTTVLYYVVAGLGALAGSSTFKAFFAGITFDNPFTAFGDFFKVSFFKVFTEGFDFSAYLNGSYVAGFTEAGEVIPGVAHSVADMILLILTGAFAFCMVDMFDTMGTLYGACARGNLLDENGNVPNVEKAMLADAVATCVGAVCGTSTVTTFVESSAGIAEGGKTGLTSIVTGILFFFAMFLTPIAKLIPTYATASALIYIGVLMMNCVTKIDWLEPTKAVPAFATIAMTVMTYSISNGIGIGLISYVLIQVFTGKFMKNEDGSVNKADIVTAVIAGLFLLMFVLTH
ncbi:MAG: NCS2 family permease [Clostridiales bacterium]|nr:NCS2 family permease [Clostridiales bacterium]